MIIEFANRSLFGKARERPDLARKVIDKLKREGIASALESVRAGLGRSLALGYSCAGVVEDVGRDAGEFAVGDRVACAGMGYASHADVVFVPKNLAVPVPDAVELEDAAYVTLGAIALQGVRVAEPRLGDAVVVIGLGLLGQLSVQLLRASGCRVIGIDVDPAKVAQTRELGAELALARSEDVVAAISRFTGGAGADAVLITAATEANDPVELAGELCRDRAVVSVVGAVRMDIPRKIYYEKELQLRLSRSYGPGRYDRDYEERGRDYPIGYVRWTERRNMAEFLRLVANGAVQPSRLTTHRIAIDNAGEAYELVTGKDRQPFSGVVLTYPDSPRAGPRHRVDMSARPFTEGAVKLGVIGAGNFATSVLLPRLKRVGGVELAGIMTATGVSARTTAERFGFRFATTDLNEILNGSATDAVVIATRHSSHATLAAQALRAGKVVFVEKPLAIDEQGLLEVVAAVEETGGRVTVGFNRRFSPLLTALRDSFPQRAPLAITYRVNAGAIPKDSWIQVPSEGGGRIIGEVCHFVDAMQFMTRDLPSEVFAHRLGGTEGVLKDTVTITIRFREGSIGTITYAATGDRSFPKERIEVFGSGTVAVLDDFRELRITRGGRTQRKKGMAQQKGFDEEVSAFIESVRTGRGASIPFDSLVATTRATLAIERALATGQPVAVEV